jgi:hypothetical protein
VTTRVKLAGHLVRTQFVYARAHATGILKGLIKR